MKKDKEVKPKKFNKNSLIISSIVLFTILIIGYFVKPSQNSKINENDPVVERSSENKTAETENISKNDSEISVESKENLESKPSANNKASLDNKNNKESKANLENKVDKESDLIKQQKEVLNDFKTDYVYGDKNAPVTIVEYASLSCPHCAEFANKAFNEIEKNYIKTKKVKYVYRDFPLNHPAFIAAIYARCDSNAKITNNPVIFMGKIKSLFATQDSWAYSKNYYEDIRNLAKIDGMSENQFDQCAENREIQENILKTRIKAAKILNIKSTPTFYINGKIFTKYPNYENLSEEIETYLKNEL